MHIVMIVIGLVVLGIALDSVRRMRSANRDSLNMGQVVRKDLGELDPLDELRSELPHGGARRVNGAEVRQPERPPKSAAFLAKQGAVAPPPPNEKRAKVEPVLGTAPSLEDTIKTRRVPVMPKPALGDTQKTANQKITPPLEPRKPPVAAATPPSKEVDLDQEVPMLMDADDRQPSAMSAICL